MNMDVTLGTALGLLGTGFVCASFAMKGMVHLRLLALVGNACFIAYGFLESQLPSIAVNTVLVPLNIRGLWEITRLTREITRATQQSPIAQWLLPHMGRRSFKAGEVLFHKGDPANQLLYVATGQLRLKEIDRPIGAGELIGEIGLFSPERARTQTLVCDTDGELYHMTDEMIFQLYYENPRLGFYLMRLLAGRLLNDVRRGNGSPAPA